MTKPQRASVCRLSTEMPGEATIGEVAAWLAERMREELASPGSQREPGIREILGSNGRGILESSDAALLVRELRAIVFPTYCASSERQQELLEELSEARAALNVERKLIALVDSLDARLEDRGPSS